MDNFINESFSENYYYLFGLPFYMKINNPYQKIIGVLSSCDNKNIDNCYDKIKDLNIDVSFWDNFMLGVNENEDVVDTFKNFVLKEYDSIDNFDKEFGGILLLNDLYQDDEILDELDNIFETYEFDSIFDNFEIESLNISEYDYKNSSVVIELSSVCELENDQISMISEYLMESCKKINEDLCDKELNGCEIKMWWNTKVPKKYRVKFIKSIVPEDDDNMFLEEELDY